MSTTTYLQQAKDTTKNIASKGYKIFVSDKNVLIPLGKPSDANIYTDEQLKKMYCKTPKPKKKKKKSNLEKLLERLY